jgi:DNA (cytosine-5)-methyltransferase 1
MGTQAMALKKLGINVENVCTSDIEPNAIIAYAMIHCGLQKDDPRTKDIDLDKAKEWLTKHNICWNFKTEQVELPASSKKITLLYLACQLSKNLGDITGIDTANVPDMDLFTFTSPCTDISRAGTQEGFAEGTNTRSSLLWECEKILRDKKPQFIMMENVKDITLRKFKPYFDAWVQKLEEYGYVCKWSIENAIDHKTPQFRERMILIGRLKKEA